MTTHLSRTFFLGLGACLLFMTSSLLAVPTMTMRGNGAIINNNDLTPRTADTTDFGTINLTASRSVTYTIGNTGSPELTLTGTPRVAISGTHAADFSITTLPSTPVSAFSGTTTFVVRFVPTAVGLRQATLSIANNDTSRNPFVFAIQGTGANPEIALEEPVGTEIVDGGARSFGGLVLGQSTVLTFNVKNVGVSDLTGVSLSVFAGNEADFTLSNLSTSTFCPWCERDVYADLCTARQWGEIDHAADRQQ